MIQGVTPTHIVPFGPFGFTAKYKRTPDQNDTDIFSLGYPMTKSVVSVIACQTCLSYETDKPPFLYFPVASLVDNASCLSCHGGISPDRLQAFRLRYTARLQCHLLGMAESDRHKAHQCTQSITALLSLCLLHEGEQKFAGSPLGHGGVHIHVHPFAV